MRVTIQTLIDELNGGGVMPTEKKYGANLHRDQ